MKTIKSETASIVDPKEVLSLEKIVYKANETGLQFVEEKRVADRLEVMKPVIRAKIMARIDDGNLSETKLKRMAEIHPEYIEHLQNIIDHKCKTDRLKIKYDSYKNLFEAKRSMLSYKKVEMKIL